MSSRSRDRRNDPPNVRLSKVLSYILRHSAQRDGLEIREDGYVKLEELMRHPKLTGKTFGDIRSIVDNNDKQRFTLIQETQEDGMPVWLIRANQGHSMEVKELELEKITDPAQIPEVIHGTYLRHWKNISKLFIGCVESQGLSKMNRNHIHCATGRFGHSGVKSGMRKSCDLFIYINVARAMEDGIEFYRSANGVILTSGVDGFLNPKYFLKVVDMNENDLISQD
ncbi:14186_t:CDS:2, partial [Acaulospora morrowiae]